MAADSGDANGLEERWKTLKDLLAALGPDLATEVIESFLKQGEDALATLRRALQQQDAAVLFEAAHGLSGSAAVLGARHLAESAGKLATSARQGDLAACAAQLPRVEQDYRDTVSRMK